MKIVQKRIFIIFVKRSITDVWKGREYPWVLQYSRFLNISRFWIYQGSEYSKVLNIPGFWICQRSEYSKVLNMTGFSIYEGSEYARVLKMSGFWIFQGPLCSRVLNIPRLHRLLNVPEYLWITPEYARLCLNIPECWTLIQPYCDRSRKGCTFPYLTIVQKGILQRDVNIFEVPNIPGFWIWLWFWICQGSEYARVLNISGFWIYQGSKYVRVLNMPDIWIYQASEYTRVLNMPGFWICRKIRFSAIAT